MPRFAAIVLSIVLAGCACTQIGCRNRIEFALDHDLVREVTYDIEVCIDATCRSASLTVVNPPNAVVAADERLSIDTELDQVRFQLAGDDYSGPHELRVFVGDETGAVLTDHSGSYEFIKTEPNGGGFCGPTCWHAEVTPPAARLP